MTQRKTKISREVVLYSGYNKLSIQVSLGGLSFCIVNCTNNSIVSYQEFPVLDENPSPLAVELTLKKAIASTEISKYRFKEVKLLFKNEKTTIVPKDLFDEKELLSYLRFNSRVIESDFLAFDEIPNTDLVNVYVAWKNLIDYAKKQFDTLQYRHYNSILIEHYIRSNSTKHETILKMVLDTNNFVLLAVNNKNLEYINSFSYRTKEDLVYFVLFCLEQLELNPAKTIIEVFGKTDMNDDRYKMLYSYIKNIRISNLVLPIPYDTVYTKEDPIYDTTPIDALL
ncbi:MAG: DUF3822 family protein [Flavobacteriaceae bacterium]|nr:DUF3822 family protein [Flavobacteriaceae bacterium]